MTTSAPSISRPSLKKDAVSLEGKWRDEEEKKWKVDDVGRGRACPTLGEGAAGPQRRPSNPSARQNIPPTASSIINAYTIFITSFL